MYNLIMTRLPTTREPSPFQSPPQTFTLPQKWAQETSIPPEHNLSPVTSPLIGRQDTLQAVSACLQENRLVTIVGLGGVGKSRLGLQIAWQSLGNYMHGVFWVALESVSRPELLANALADAMGFRFYSTTDPRQQLNDYLSERQALLVLDNFEHILSAAGWLPELLRHAPGLRLLCTSRQRLGLYEETVYKLEGLSLPAEDNPDELETSSAVQLFVQAARRVCNDISPTPEDFTQIGRICRLVGGLPLALEMAAAWVRVLSCGEIADQIEQDLNFLGADWRNPPERHRSLRVVCDHSWASMDAAEQASLARLSVFHTSFQRPAAEQVAGATLDVLKGLVDRSLLHWDIKNGRYDLHPLLRQYAADQLGKQPAEGITTESRHCGYYMGFLAQRLPALLGDGQVEALNEIAAELENIRLAWHWATIHRKADEFERGMRTLCHFFFVRSHFYEGEQLFSQAAEQLQTENIPENETHTIANLETCQAAMLNQLGRYAEASTLLEHALPILEKQGIFEEITRCLNELGYAAFRTGKREWAQQLAERMLLLAQESYLAFEKAHALKLLANICNYEDLAKQETLYRQALQIFTEIGYPLGQAVTLMNLGIVCFHQGLFQESQHYQERALQIYESLQDPLNQAGAYTNLSLAINAQGDTSSAIFYCQKALPVSQQTGCLLLEVIISRNLAVYYSNIGYYQLALIAEEQALARSQKIGEPLQQAIELDNLSALYYDIEQYERSLKYSVQALGIFQTLQNKISQSYALLNQSRILLALGNYKEAWPSLLEAHEIRKALKQDHLILESTAQLAWSGLQVGQPLDALPFAEEALALLDTTLPVTHECRWRIYQVFQANNDARAHAVLQEARHELLEQAARISNEDHRRSFLENVKAHREILAEWERIHSPPPAETPEPAPKLLTPRELEVLQQMADGNSTKEIANHLSISLGTVKIHAHCIYEKLGVSGRLQAVNKARQQGVI